MTDSQKNYTLFRTERSKTIPCPAAHPSINLGEEPSKRFSEAAGSVFWVSLPDLPGDTDPNYFDRGTQLAK